MAIKQINDYEEAITQFIHDAASYHNENAHYTGVDFDTYMKEKAALKARRYNIINQELLEEQVESELERSANEYRKASNGE